MYKGGEMVRRSVNYFLSCCINCKIGLELGRRKREGGKGNKGRGRAGKASCADEVIIHISEVRYEQSVIYLLRV